MGKGMQAGRAPKLDKDLKKAAQAYRRYEEKERKRLVDAVRVELEEEVTQTISYYHNLDMIAVMFALRDEFGFGKSRLLRTMKKSIEHVERMQRDRADVDVMLGILNEETGIREEELTWETEVEIP